MEPEATRPGRRGGGGAVRDLDRHTPAPVTGGQTTHPSSQPPHVAPCNAPPRPPDQISEEHVEHPADDEDAQTVRSVLEMTTGGATPGLAHRPPAAARAAADAPRPAGEMARAVQGRQAADLAEPGPAAAPAQDARTPAKPTTPPPRARNPAARARRRAPRQHDVTPAAAGSRQPPQGERMKGPRRDADARGLCPPALPGNGEEGRRLGYLPIQ
nr:translation initiation factor IF-2-like [Aegilops tauschii subsp. strangulata]